MEINVYLSHRPNDVNEHAPVSIKFERVSRPSELPSSVPKFATKQLDLDDNWGTLDNIRMI